jgi:hypothetical protein
MGWAGTVRVVAQALASMAELLVAAFVDGERVAFQRVSKIIPPTLQSEAKLIHEEARSKRGGK